MTAASRSWTGTLVCGAHRQELEIGRIAPQAGGSAALRAGRMVLSVAVCSGDPKSGAPDFLPLTVEYREKLAGAGRIPGGFLRREARPGAHEVLGARLIDRSIRPLFPPSFRAETQLIATLLSFDPEIDPEVQAINAASAALLAARLPWHGPVAAVRIARVNGVFVAFPSPEERASAGLDLVVAVTRRGLVMIEGCAQEVPEDALLEALDRASEAAAPLLDTQEELAAAIGGEGAAVWIAPPDPAPAAVAHEIVTARIDRLYAATDKHARHACREEIRVAVAEGFPVMNDSGGVAPAEGRSAAPGAPSPRELADEALRAEIRRRALAGQRLDGRDARAVRPVSADVGCLPGAHGSSFFARGETHAWVTCTLGAAEDEQLVEDLQGLHRERFLLHYNFPPYAVGEVRPLRGPGRREIGHGHLARRALLPVLPSHDAFPYTIRIEAEITSSNGSSSMATVCGATLALMDAGVPIRRPVAGIAMGLIAEGEQHAVLTDILGDEDHLGDMDFKIAGTTEGVTALQLDNKLGSLPREILAAALEQAREGRLHILSEMLRGRAAPREAVPAHAPRVVSLRIRPARIRDLIGPGGRHIQELQKSNGVTVEVEDDGRVRIFGSAGAGIQEAVRRIRYLTGEPETGKIYRGQVTGITDFGCFVQIFHGIEGLVHISELDRQPVRHPSEIAVSGAEMLVKVLGATREGKLRLSRKEALDAAPGDVTEI